MYFASSSEYNYLSHPSPYPALDTLPATLDETYERTLREIKEEKWGDARRLLLCVAVASRPLRVGELAEILAFDFEAGSIPRFFEDARLQNPIEAVLTTCSTLPSVVEDWRSQVVQFAHFSVKEYLTSARFAEKDDAISRRYRTSMTPAHTLVAQVCLGMLLHLHETVTRDSLANFPLAQYAAEHWLDHARFEGVSQNVIGGMKQLFDCRKHHLTVWLWIYDPTVPSFQRDKLAKVPLPPCGTPLHYAAFCGLHYVVETLAIENSQDVNSRSFDNESTPLHLASREGHEDVARILFEHGADTEARAKDGETPLHLASQGNHAELAQLLLGHHADVAAQTKDGETPLHLASQQNHVELARLLLKHSADVAARTKDQETPLHLASDCGHLELARPLFEHGADVAAQTKDGVTPLHLASDWGHITLARLLLEYGADAAAKTKNGSTPLQRASYWGHVELIGVLDVASMQTQQPAPV